jgi:hypothetical protein
MVDPLALQVLKEKLVGEVPKVLSDLKEIKAIQVLKVGWGPVERWVPLVKRGT